MLQSKVKKFILLIFLILFFPFSAVQAVAIDVTIEVKESFGLGETLSFDYKLISALATNIVYTPHISCPNAPVALLTELPVTLEANVPYDSTYQSGLPVDDTIEPQTCTAYVQILSPIEKVVEKEFKIDTSPSFEVEVFVCKDKLCLEKSRVFSQGERAYVAYRSEPSGLEVVAKVMDEEVSLPGIIPWTEAGKYSLEIEAKKQGYKTNIQTLEIVVLEGEAKVIETEICNENKICEADKGETVENCSLDCVSAEIETTEIETTKVETEPEQIAPPKKGVSRVYYLGLGLIGLVLLVILGLILKLRRDRADKDQFTR